MLPKQMLNMLCYFDVCGFNSGSSRVSQNGKVNNFIYFVHILTAIFLTMFEFRLMADYFPSLGLTEAITESLEYSAALYTYWLIIFDSLMHRQAHANFWNTLHHIDRQFSCQPKYAIRSYMVKFYAYSIKTISIVVIRLTISSITGFIIDFAYIALFIVCEVRMFYYLYCLEILHMQLKIVASEVRTMTTILNATRQFHLANCNVITTCESFEMQRMKWIREYFHDVHKMMSSLNIVFGWSHVGAIMFCFYYLLTESNWLYIHFNNIPDINRAGERPFDLSMN